MAEWYGFTRWLEMNATFIKGRLLAFKDGGAASTTLHRVILQITSDSECNNAYAAYGGITDRMICAGDPNGGRGACQVTESL